MFSKNLKLPMQSGVDAADVTRPRLERDSAIWWTGLIAKHRRHVPFITFQVVAEGLAVAVAVLFAYLMRYSWPASMQPFERTLTIFVPSLLQLVNTPEFRPYVLLLIASPIVYLLAFQSMRIFTYPYGELIPFCDVAKILRGTVAGTILVVLVGFIYSNSRVGAGYDYPTLFFVYLASLTVFAVVLVHSATLIALLCFRMTGAGRIRSVIVGADSGARGVAGILGSPSSQYSIVGFVAVGEDDKESGARVLGQMPDLRDIINRHNVDVVVLAVDPAILSTSQRVSIAELCWRMGAELKMVAPFFPFLHTSTHPQQVGGLPLLHVEKAGLYSRWPQIAKRAMDIVISIAALVLSAPIWLAAIIAIKAGSKGPVFFVQERVGLNGRVFRMLKFRSMEPDADVALHREYLERLIKGGESAGIDAAGKPVYKMTRDPRITGIGNILRKTSVDELPQLINVLRGEMSLVGPRPPIQYEVDQYEEWHERRLHIRPGITGLWQVSGRSRLTYEEMIRLDIDYIQNWTIWTDVKILLKTIPVVLHIGQSY